MGSYTVVIIAHPDRADLVDASTPRLTIQVDGRQPDLRVTGIAIDTTDPKGLTSSNIPDVDIAAIVSALASKFTPRVKDSSSASSRVDLPGLRPENTNSAPNSFLVATECDDVRPSSSQPNAAMEPFSDDAPPDSRPYRRMPDVDELRSLYEDLGTVTALAKHYGVPRHTAQGWMGRLRKQAQLKTINEHGKRSDHNGERT
ncbi:hypothetical protein [Nocardia salmonicida]|uniref:hypothetical protein n=1 Tax=Nocardia salmonicida TaxID=53431 RepID=UPI0010422B5B|nr:hypothetical protein [Nocardia salmonicida]